MALISQDQKEKERELSQANKKRKRSQLQQNLVRSIIVIFCRDVDRTRKCQREDDETDALAVSARYISLLTLYDICKCILLLAQNSDTVSPSKASCGRVEGLLIITLVVLIYYCFTIHVYFQLISHEPHHLIKLPRPITVENILDEFLKSKESREAAQVMTN